jgi:hypothetical protein
MNTYRTYRRSIAVASLALIAIAVAAFVVVAVTVAMI